MRLVLSCLPTLGGSAISTVRLAQALADRGHTVHVVSARRPFAADSMTGDVTFHAPAGGSHPVLADGALDWLRCAELVGVVARDVRADVVNPHYLGGLLPATVLAVAALAPQAALVASAHGTDVSDPAPGTLALQAGLLRDADGVTAVSPYLAGLLQSRFGVSRSRVRVVSNWVEPPPEPSATTAALLAAARQDDHLLLVHSSNYRPVKRATRCADALAAVVRVRPARLLLVGDGPDLDAVLARARELGVADRVVAAGVQCPEQAQTLVAQSDIALVPSASEACSGVLLQALAAGVPSVAYAVGGNSGVITDGRTGWLLPDELAGDGFATAVARLAADVELRSAMRIAGPVAASRFRRDETVAGYERAFATAVRRRARRLLRAS